MTSNATATHRVFDALQGLYPVTFANVREADPEGLLDIFEGADNTRDAYFEHAIMGSYGQARAAGHRWADYLKYFGTDHEDECQSPEGCACKAGQWHNNQQWGTELYEAIEQRIDELNG